MKKMYNNFLEELWLEEMGWNVVDADNRKFNDDVERAFWEKLAPVYTTNYNLNSDTDKIANKLRSILGYNKKVLEIGCGSGNFTMLMADYCKEIIGIDFSAAMLNELNKRVESSKLENIRIVNCKWEDFKLNEKYDYIVSVNSLYRIRDIKQALLKMDAYAKKGVVIIRTIQRPFLYSLYAKCGISANECRDYQLMPVILWQNGIRANVEFVNYKRTKFYNNIQEAEAEMQQDLGKVVFEKNKSELMKDLLKFTQKDIDGYMIKMPRVTEFIYWKKLYAKD